jgi:hypothetical protein
MIKNPLTLGIRMLERGSTLVPLGTNMGNKPMEVDEFAKRLAQAFESRALALQASMQDGSVDGFKSLIVAAQPKSMLDARDCVLEAAGMLAKEKRGDNIIKFPRK